jgi:murein DD-endopeptidase MepM/ murein hydrolase activator NlpD
MPKNKKISCYLTLIPIAIILCLFIWLFTIIFEGEKPLVRLEPLPEFLSKKQTFTLNVSDLKRGLKEINITYNQGGSKVTLFEQKFPFEGLLNRKGVRNFKKELDVDPSDLHLAQGRVDLEVQVWDYSRRSGGDGNMSVLQHRMTVDTIPPAIRAISRMHNISQGGAGLVVYRASSDTIESGLYVDELFFQGFPAEEKSKEGIYLAYFALPYNSSLDPSIYLWAKDRAENTTNATFYYHVRKNTFSSEKINISDSFLKRVLPYFSDYDFDPQDSDIEKYIKINNDLRKKDDEFLSDLMKKTEVESYWEGPWLSLKNAATMARFADHRTYYYKGEKIDEQYHLGIDLASLANSPVEAGNSGKVLFAGKNGIYGLMVVIDHGQGLASLYGHLSGIGVATGDIVKKGDIIGNTGQTGLAGGDHLHFSMLVHGVFVNPLEWLDEHWITDNITSKLDLINQ